MHFAHTLDDLGKPAWIALTVLGFIAWWPIGLALLAYTVGSGRMSCWRRGHWGRWYGDGVDRAQDAVNRAQDHVNRAQEHVNRWCGSGRQRPASSGNRAFDEYRAETLKRLEEEEQEFRSFLDRLRVAKDKAEFDEFLAERRRGREGPHDQGPQAQV
jgi:hypothetical protein